MKHTSILPFNWQPEQLGGVEYISIDDDLILLDKPVITSAFRYPFRMDVTVGFVCIKGTSEGFINMSPYTAQAPYLITILPGDIVEYKSISEDFSGLIIIMSKKFTDSLMPDAYKRLPLFFSLRDNPVFPLSEEFLEGIIRYFEMLKRMAQEKDHPYRLEVAQHLTLAFFYGGCVDFHQLIDKKKKTHHEMLVEKFLHLVQNHHKKQRGLEFYADKMCLTSKHLSKVIKATSGKSANDLIDERVILEAKALLKSTNMTIEQISDELNFPSQSFFGKYFKRITGMSPKEYKK